MTDQEEHNTLTTALDALEAAVEDDDARVAHVVEALGRRSFTSVLLIAALVSTSPASAVPGLTTAVALVILVLVPQMIAGRDHLWLPRFVMSRRVPRGAVSKGARWLRRPVGWLDRVLRPRLKALCHRPWVVLPLALVMALALVMPFLEVIPLSGSLASAVVALVAAGLLVRDGALVTLASLPLLALAAVIWRALAG
ncbi:exopolysaccharide biosynthesis protein [Frigidibacter sp. MR17.24]|uniref:exopolysaccharide biosynthesis protein n=1 Tax=Frigidibacter sp. MR17.24 TaxID=3127345 RepID=UPI003012BA36